VRQVVQALLRNHHPPPGITKYEDAAREIRSFATYRWPRSAYGFRWRHQQGASNTGGAQAPIAWTRGTAADSSLDSERGLNAAPADNTCRVCDRLYTDCAGPSCRLADKEYETASLNVSW